MIKKILTPLAIIFIIYILIQNSLYNLENYFASNQRNATNSPANPETQLVSPSNEFEGNALERLFARLLVNILKTEEGKAFFENMIVPLSVDPIASQKQALNLKDFFNSVFQIKETGLAKGERTALCGSNVRVNYKLFSASGELIKKGVSNYTVGLSDLDGLNIVVPGMKVGQTRNANIVYKFLKHLNKDERLKSGYKINIELVDILDPPLVMEDIKLFDNAYGYDTPLICGNKVSAKLNISDVSENKIIYDQKVDFTLGDQNFPRIIYHALHWKMPIGSKAIILDGKYIKPTFIKNKGGENIAINSQHKYLIEISDIDIVSHK